MSSNDRRFVEVVECEGENHLATMDFNGICMLCGRQEGGWVVKPGAEPFSILTPVVDDYLESIRDLQRELDTWTEDPPGDTDE